jgi:hypothetical protein
MLKRFGMTAVLLFAFSTLGAVAQQQWGRPHPPRAGACFYRDAGFNGDYFCMRVGDRWPSLPHGFEDSITSIRVFGGARLRLFNDHNFGGINTRIDHDVDSLLRYRLPENPSKSWNDRVSSIAVFGDHDDWDRH